MFLLKKVKSMTTAAAKFINNIKKEFEIQGNGERNENRYALC